MPASPACCSRMNCSSWRRGLSLVGDAVADVRPVEAVQELARGTQVQALDDLAARGGIGGGGERDARHLGIALGQHRQLQVFGAEVVAPLRDAVRLVDGEQRDGERIEQRQPAFGDQPLRRHVEQVELTGAGALLHRLRLAPVQAGVQERGAHARLAQRGHLVLHQRDQRRDHHADAGTQQRRDLVAQGFAAAGGHEHQRIAAGGHVFDDGGLLSAKGGIAEDVAQQAFRPGKHPAIGRRRRMRSVANCSGRYGRHQRCLVSAAAPWQRLPGRTAGSSAYPA